MLNKHHLLLPKEGSFYRCKHASSERLGDVPKVTQYQEESNPNRS